MLTIEKSTIVESENKDAEELETAFTGLRTRIRDMDTQARRGTNAQEQAKNAFQNLREFELGSGEHIEAAIALTGLYVLGELETPSPEIAVEIDENIEIIVGYLAMQRYSADIAA